jgi:hypothetical protein
MTEEDRISNLFGSQPLGEDEEEGLMFSEEAKKASPAMALTEQLLNRQRIQDIEDIVDAEPGPRHDPDYPDRPQHEDFWKMSEIIRRTDALADQTEDVNILDLLTMAGIDVDSVQYMARQRVARAISRIPPPADEVERRAEDYAAWMDGFLLGYQLAKKDAPQIQQLLDESIDGKRRQQP